MARVSVLIPAFRPDYLRQAIASVLAQTFSDYELLISDDCPDDGVKRVVREFGDKRIRLLEGPRQGLVANSAFLFEQAQGQFLKYVYDDDFLLPFAISKLGTLLNSRPEASFAFCMRHFVSADGSLRDPPRGIKAGPARMFADADLRGVMVSNLTNYVGEPTNTLIRRSFFPDADCLRVYAGLPIRHLIDMAFYLNALKQGPSIGLGEVHAAFRRHGSQTTSTNNPGLSIGVLEWEILIRSDVGEGRITPESALSGLEELERRYVAIGRAYPELDAFREALPDLRARIERRETGLLDEAFRASVAEATRIVEDRRRRPAGAGS